ncbi:MAG TPA: hypothetical protein PKY56_00145 [Candidatus Kapabacteria bacterium]|nr:hypothetical protein [Candidatus Kapabacteria bacterium]
MENKFNFWVPLEIEKSGEGENKKMRLKGIASTFDEDTDGEFLDPKGFDLSYLKKIGTVNWHHQSKNSPKTIIGEPIKAEITNKGLYTEVELYKDSQMAREVFELAELFEKNSKTRRLGFSIEGKVLERDPLNEKIIRRANITGIAVTHMPKNSHTFAEIMKGEVDFIPLEYEEQESPNGGCTTIAEINRPDGSVVMLYSDGKIVFKALDTNSGRPLKKEHVDGNEKGLKFKTKEENILKKADVYEKIFNDFSGITFEKAKEIYGEIIKPINNMENIEITKELIEKAYEVLGLTPDVEEQEEIIKAVDKKEEDEEVEKCGDTKFVKSEKGEDKEEENEEDEEDEDEEDEDEEDEDEEDEDEKPKKKKREIKKSFGEEGDIDIVKAVGVVLTDIRNQFKKDFSDFRNEMSEKFEELSSAPQPRKSISKAIERFEERTEDANTLSLSKDRGKILNLIENLTFVGGGIDETFAKGLTIFESANQLPSEVIFALKQKGYTIIK